MVLPVQSTAKPELNKHPALRIMTATLLKVLAIALAVLGVACRLSPLFFTFSVPLCVFSALAAVGAFYLAPPIPPKETTPAPIQLRSASNPATPPPLPVRKLHFDT